MQYLSTAILAFALGASARPQAWTPDDCEFPPPPPPVGSAPPVTSAGVSYSVPGVPSGTGYPAPSGTAVSPVSSSSPPYSAPSGSGYESPPFNPSASVVPAASSEGGSGFSSVIVDPASASSAAASYAPGSSAGASSAAASSAEYSSAAASSAGPSSAAASSAAASSAAASYSAAAPSVTIVPSGTLASGGGLPASSGTSVLSAAQTIAAGESFDCGMVAYDRGVSCTEGEGGDSDAVFMLENGASLSNCIIGPNQLEGVHCFGSCKLTNVWWSAVCEDAFTVKEQEAGETTTISGGGAFGAEDKVLQHNGGGTLSVTGFTVDNFGKVYRSCGNCDEMYERHVIMDDITASSGSQIAGINSNYGDTATLSNIKISDVDTVCATYEGNDTGDEPPMIGEGPSDACLYSESDVTEF